MVGGGLSVADHDVAEERFCLQAPPEAFVGCTLAVRREIKQMQSAAWLISMARA